MIINDKNRIVIVHIPKCAGTTLRETLLPFDDASGRFYKKAVSNHPELGPLDYHHIPLALLKDHFAADYERLESYASYALVRDPFARFPSSLNERLMQRDKRPLGNRNLSDIAKEVDTVLNALSRMPGDRPITAPEFIHFSRQADYVFLDRQQIVKNVYPISMTRDLVHEISGLLGKPIAFESAKNERHHHRFRFLETLQLAVTRPIEKALPRALWKPVFTSIKSAFFATGIMRKGGDPIAELPNAAEIKAFISEFYADDIRLYEAASDRTKHGT